MAEDQPALAEDADAFYDEAQIELNRKVMEKAKDDEDFRAHMQDDPEGALRDAGLLDEAKALADQDRQESEEVEGHAWWHRTYYRTCRWWERRIYWHRT